VWVRGEDKAHVSQRSDCSITKQAVEQEYLLLRAVRQLVTMRDKHERSVKWVQGNTRQRSLRTFWTPFFVTLVPI
jgi:hypothetical protein